MYCVRVASREVGLIIIIILIIIELTSYDVPGLVSPTLHLLMLMTMLMLRWSRPRQPDTDARTSLIGRGVDHVTMTSSVT